MMHHLNQISDIYSLRGSKNLSPSFPQQREKTITSAPSLIVLVLKPFPSNMEEKEKIKQGQINN